MRPKHIESAKINNSKNIMPFGGAMLESHVADGEIPNFKGSVLLVRAASSEEAREILEKDIYVKSGVWDMSKAQIIPFKTALTPVL